MYGERADHLTYLRNPHALRTSFFLLLQELYPMHFGLQQTALYDSSAIDLIQTFQCEYSKRPWGTHRPVWFGLV
jgi:hypothetical protein